MASYTAALEEALVSECDAAGEELWFVSPRAELQFRKPQKGGRAEEVWGKGRLAVFRERLAFISDEGDAGVCSLRFADMLPEKAVEEFEKSGRRHGEAADRVVLLRAPHHQHATKLAEVGEGLQLRGLPEDPHDPKRLCRLLDFLWRLAKGKQGAGGGAGEAPAPSSLPPPMWAGLQRAAAAAPGGLLPRRAAAAAAAQVMYPRWTRVLERCEPGARTLSRVLDDPAPAEAAAADSAARWAACDHVAGLCQARHRQGRLFAGDATGVDAVLRQEAADVWVLVTRFHFLVKSRPHGATDLGREASRGRSGTNSRERRAAPGPQQQQDQIVPWSAVRCIYRQRAPGGLETAALQVLVSIDTKTGRPTASDVCGDFGRLELHQFTAAPDSAEYAYGVLIDAWVGTLNDAVDDGRRNFGMRVMRRGSLAGSKRSPKGRSSPKARRGSPRYDDAASGAGSGVPGDSDDVQGIGLPPAAVRRLLDHFQSIDADRSGTIEQRELLDAFGPLFLSYQLPRAFFRTFDVDGDGRVSFVEFLTGMSMLLEGRTNPRKGCEFSFLLFDEDGNGVVDKEEFKHLIMIFLQLSGANARDVLKDSGAQPAPAETNATLRSPTNLREGYQARQLLDEASACELAERLFDMIDEDKNGVLDFDEFSTALSRVPQVDKAFRKMKRQEPNDPLRVQSMMTEDRFVSFGHPDWTRVVDLLDGIRHSTFATEFSEDRVVADEELRIDADEKVKYRKILMKPSDDGGDGIDGGTSAAFFRYEMLAGDYKVHSEGGKETVFTDYAPKIFNRIRRIFGFNRTDYMSSLGLNSLLINMLTGSVSSMRQMLTNAASAQMFFASHDNRFILRTITQVESEHLRLILPDYINYVRSNPDTLLTRYYQMGALHSEGTKFVFVVMGNIFQPQRPIGQMYNLKGSIRSRAAWADKDDEPTHDELMQSTDRDLRRCFQLNFEWHDQLLTQLESDVQFLADNECTGYSFLLGASGSKVEIDGEDGPNLADATAEARHLSQQEEEKKGGRKLCFCCGGAKKQKGADAGAAGGGAGAREPFADPGSPSPAQRQLVPGQITTSDALKFLRETHVSAKPRQPTTSGGGRAQAAEKKEGDDDDADAADATAPDGGDSPTKDVAAPPVGVGRGVSVRPTVYPRPSVYQSVEGGLPSADGSEIYYVGIIDILTPQTAKNTSFFDRGRKASAVSRRTDSTDVDAHNHEEAEFYARNLELWMSRVLSRVQQPKMLSLTNLTDATTFSAKLESGKAISVTVSKHDMQIFITSTSGKKEATVEVCKPFDWWPEEAFSIEKPTDKDRPHTVYLRRAPRIEQRGSMDYSFHWIPAAKGGTQEELVRRIDFLSLVDREEFCSLVAVLRRHRSMQVNKERKEVMKMGMQQRGISLFFATWNVGEYPPGEDGALSDWLGPARDSDIVAVAAQECDYKHRKGYTSCEEDWFMTLLKTLNTRGSPDELARGLGEKLEGDERFLVIEGLTMWQMRLIVFTKRKHMHLVSDTTKKEEATGIMHVGGNKGGVTIALKFCDTPICFVGCHLAAHQGEMQRRAGDINEIIEGVSSFLGSSNMFFNIEYPQVFWAGDLNYRIDTSQDSKKMPRRWVDRIKIRDRPEVINLIEKARGLDAAGDPRSELRDTLDLLRSDDQLLKAMWTFGADRAGGQKQLLPSFIEAGPLKQQPVKQGIPGVPDINEIPRKPGPYFIPTFKVIPRHKSKEEDDERRDHDAINGFNHERVPAWCDRVLRSRTHSHPCESKVATERYTMVPEIVTSDHKPVSCTFSMNVREQYLFSPGCKTNRNEEPLLVVQLSDLCADGLIALDPDGKSDPYLEVVCSFSTQRPKTKPVMCSLSPQWKDSLVLAVDYGDRTCLDGEYLYFLLYDHDTITRDDILGQAVVSLHGKVGSPGVTQQHGFEADLFLLGHQEGRIWGSVTIGELSSQEVYDAAREKKEGRHKAPLLRSGGGMKASRLPSGQKAARALKKERSGAVKKTTSGLGDAASPQ